MERHKCIALWALCTFALASPVFAETTLYVSPISVERGVGADQAFRVMVTPPEEPINVLAGTLIINARTATVTAIHTGESVVPLWIEAPRFEGGRIEFAGMFPGGFDGVREPLIEDPQDGVLFTVWVRTEEFGEATFTLDDVTLYANDGSATPLVTRVVPATLAIGGYREDTSTGPARDVTPPEPFSIQIAAHEAVHEGAFTAVFTTRDAESGIDRYELAEIPQERTEPQEDEWRVVKSPARLNDQTRASRIFVKAIDRAGNERVSTLMSGQSAERGFADEKRMRILIVIALVVVVLALLLWLRRRF